MTDNQTQCEKCCVRDGDNKMYYECCCAEDAITVMKDNERARREGYVEVNGRWIKKHRLVIKCSKCVCHVPVNQFNIEKKMCMDCDSKNKTKLYYCYGCNNNMPLREFSFQMNNRGFKLTKFHSNSPWCNSCNQSVIDDRKKISQYESDLKMMMALSSHIENAKIVGEKVEFLGYLIPKGSFDHINQHLYEKTQELKERSHEIEELICMVAEK